MRLASVASILMRQHRFLTLSEDGFLLFGKGSHHRPLLDVLDISELYFLIFKLILVQLLLPLLVQPFLHHNFPLNLGQLLLLLPNPLLKFLLVRLDIIIPHLQLFSLFFFQIRLNNFLFFLQLIKNNIAGRISELFLKRVVVHIVGFFLKLYGYFMLLHLKRGLNRYVVISNCGLDPFIRHIHIVLHLFILFIHDCALVGLLLYVD